MRRDFFLVSILVCKQTGYSLLIADRFSAQPLTILGVTGPFSVLAENIYTLCKEHFHVRFSVNDFNDLIHVLNSL